MPSTRVITAALVKFGPGMFMKTRKRVQRGMLRDSQPPSRAAAARNDVPLCLRQIRGVYVVGCGFCTIVTLEEVEDGSKVG